MSALAGLAAAAAVLLAAGPGHRGGRTISSTESRPRRGRRAVGVLGRAVQAAGRALRAAAGRRPDPSADRRAGMFAVAVAAVLAVGPVPTLAGSALLALSVRARRLRRARHRHRTPEIERDLPDVVDLLALAVGAGLSVPGAIPVVAPLAPSTVRADLVVAAGELASGRSSDDVVVGLGHRWGPPARPLVHALADHLRYGTPVLPALERVATEARAARRRAAETRARRLPVLLLLPLVLCTLPAFALLTVAPLVAGTFDSLRGGHLEAPASVAPP